MRRGIALVGAWLTAGGCAELGSPSGGTPAVDAGPQTDASSSIDELPPRDSGPVDDGPVASCAAELERTPGAADGVYSIDRGDGAEDVYCDMGNGGVTYQSLAFGNSFSTYADHEGATAADLAEPAVQQAFIYLYNRQGSAALNLDVGYNSGNCCFRGAGAAAGTVLVFGADHYLYPADTTVNTANCNTTYGAASYRFMFGDKEIYPPAPLPSDYFTTNPPGELVNCTDDNNPGFFFKRF